MSHYRLTLIIVVSVVVGKQLTIFSSEWDSSWLALLVFWFLVNWIAHMLLGGRSRDRK